jgi:hypothetical protein
MTYNPNSPAALGLEWCPVHEVAQAMTSAVTPYAARFTSTSNNTINQAWMYAPGSTIQGTPETYQLDIYRSGVFPSPTVTTLKFVPTGDGGNLGSWWWNGSTIGNTNLYTHLNNPVQTPVAILNGTADDDFIYNPGGQAYAAQFWFNGINAACFGKHIVKIRTEARVQPLSAFNDRQAMTVVPYLIFSGICYYGTEQTFVDRQPGGHVCSQEWAVNPSQQRGWIPNDMAAFENSGLNAAGWLVRPSNATTIYAAIYSVNMQVDHLGNDVRDAIAWITPATQTAGIAGWFPMPLWQLSGNTWVQTGWQKQLGVDYLLMFRRHTANPGGLQLAVQALSGFDNNRTPNGWARANVTLLPDPIVPAASSIVDDGRSWAPVIGFVDAGTGNTTADSQPYAVLEQDSAISTGVDFRQYFTTPASLPVTAFGLLRVTLGQTSTGASITFRVRRSSDNVQLGSTVTITPQDFLDDDATPHQTAFALYKTLTARLATPATLATSTTYYLQVQSSASVVAPWRVESARTVQPGGATPNNANLVTYSGTNGLVISGVSHPEADASLVLLTVPAAPATMTAASRTPGSVPCARYQKLNWSATSLGGTFAYYELQRNDRPVGVWQTISRVVVESLTEFHDWEASYGYSVSWRVRVARTDGAISDWTSVTLTTETSPCCGYVFTSNEVPEYTLWADDVSDGKRTVELPQTVTTRQFYNRDFQVGFFELENRGATFKRTVLIAGSGAVDGTAAPVTVGLDNFAALLGICRPNPAYGANSYVCVHETDSGNRWFATVLTPSVSREEPAGRYLADVEIIESTSVPAVLVQDTFPSP